MDCGSVYVKICGKAEEIQKLWQPKAWDYCYCKQNEKTVVLSGYETDGGFYGHGYHSYEDWALWGPSDIEKIVGCKSQDKTGHIWIPRQDQLQEMIPSPMESYEPCFRSVSLIGEIENFTLKRHQSFTDEAMKFTSMEQLWLAFVMSKLYHKVWDGMNWEKSNAR